MRTVYFIKPVGMCGPIKIGCSCSPDQRRQTLENWSPFALEIVAEIDGDLEIERRFHAAFAHQHQSREWFAWSKPLQQTIDEINAGEFDVESLPPPQLLVVNREAASRSQKAAWTPERRMVASYSARLRHVQIKTGTICRVPGSMASYPEQRAQIDAYLADPHMYGETIAEHLKRTGWLPWWARKAA